MTTKEMHRPESILIVRLSAIGDVAHVLPALRCLRQRFPYSRITWLVEDRTEELLRDHPYLDQIIVFPRKKWRQALLNPLKVLSTLPEIISFFLKMRRGRFEVAIDFQGNLKSGVMTFLSGAPLRIGFAQGHSREGNYLFMNRRITPPEGRVHKIEKDLSLLSALGIKEPTYEPTSPSVSAQDRDYISQFLSLRGKGAGPLVVIHPGTSDFGAFKRWPSQSYARLGDMLVRELGAQVVISWGPSELPIAEDILGGMKEGGFLAPRTLTLGQLTSLIGHSDLFISGDTGPMHIASLLGVPQVAIFGPKDPAIYGPYSENSVAVRKDLECSPCTKRSCDHVTCITSISPEEVFVAAKKLLTRHAHTRTAAQARPLQT
jgi:lipopolysaccharide heptosyltransferase I